ncbi:hypothetical protein C7B76_20645 [filamentous cyanobacterium CCP2]|nr:hypothetical protein C7B76_20645 [filamentous cyanobacterium CCP2]
MFLRAIGFWGKDGIKKYGVRRLLRLKRKIYGILLYNSLQQGYYTDYPLFIYPNQVVIRQIICITAHAGYLDRVDLYNKLLACFAYWLSV